MNINYTEPSAALVVAARLQLLGWCLLVAVCTCPSMEHDGQTKKNKKTDKLCLLAPRRVDPPPQIFRVCRGGCTLHISSQHYMGPTPVYGASAEKPLQNADFAMKQTNICRLSGDIIMLYYIQIYTVQETTVQYTVFHKKHPLHILIISHSNVDRF